jgi:hypothetical protein
VREVVREDDLTCTIYAQVRDKSEEFIQ